MFLWSVDGEEGDQTMCFCGVLMGGGGRSDNVFLWSVDGEEGDQTMCFCGVLMGRREIRQCVFVEC